MKFFWPATLTLHSARARSPIHQLALVAGVGLLSGYGPLYSSPMAAQTVSIVQDNEQDQDPDGKLEVVVIQDDENERNQPTALNEQEPSQEFEVVVAQEEEQEGDISRAVHGHLVELMHGNGSNKIDHRELARKLREIADQLEGNNKDVEAGRQIQEEFEILPGGDHQIFVLRQPDVQKSNKETRELRPDSDGRLLFQPKGVPQHLIIELEADGDANAHGHPGDHPKMTPPGKEQDGNQKVIVEEFELKDEPSSLGHDLSVEEAMSSEEGHQSEMGALRNELQKLRQELNQLRSKQPTPKSKRKRRNEGVKAGIQTREAGVPARLVERLRQTSPSGADAQLIWVEEEASDKSGNRFILRQPDNVGVEAKSKIIRLDVKKVERESEESDQKVDQD